MAYLRRMRAGFVLGMTPGMVGFIVAAVFWASGTGHLTVLVVVVMPLVFAAIGGVLGVMVNALFVYVRLRTRQPITRQQAFRVGGRTCSGHGSRSERLNLHDALLGPGLLDDGTGLTPPA